MGRTNEFGTGIGVGQPTPQVLPMNTFKLQATLSVPEKHFVTTFIQKVFLTSTSPANP